MRDQVVTSAVLQRILLNF